MYEFQNKGRCEVSTIKNRFTVLSLRSEKQKYDIWTRQIFKRAVYVHQENKLPANLYNLPDKLT